MGGENIALTGKSAQDHHEVSRDGEPRYPPNKKSPDASHSPRSPPAWVNSQTLDTIILPDLALEHAQHSHAPKSQPTLGTSKGLAGDQLGGTRKDFHPLLIGLLTGRDAAIRPNSVTPQRTRNDRIAASDTAKQSVDDARSDKLTDLVLEMAAERCRLRLMASFLDRSAHFMSERASHAGWASQFDQGNYLARSAKKRKLLAFVRTAYWSDRSFPCVAQDSCGRAGRGRGRQLLSRPHFPPSGCNQRSSSNQYPQAALFEVRG
jgi:hypothetical protein